MSCRAVSIYLYIAVTLITILSLLAMLSVIGYATYTVEIGPEIAASIVLAKMLTSPNCILALSAVGLPSPGELYFSGINYTARPDLIAISLSRGCIPSSVLKNYVVLVSIETLDSNEKIEFAVFDNMYENGVKYYAKMVDRGIVDRDVVDRCCYSLLPYASSGGESLYTECADTILGYEINNYELLTDKGCVPDASISYIVSEGIRRLESKGLLAPAAEKKALIFIPEKKKIKESLEIKMCYGEDCPMKYELYSGRVIEKIPAILHIAIYSKREIDNAIEGWVGQ